MHTDEVECSADPFVLSAHAYPGLILEHGCIVGHGFFRAESSDLSHMGIYMGMDVISVWALLRVNTVVKLQTTTTT